MSSEQTNERDELAKRNDINDAVASEIGITPEESDMIGRVVAESLRRSDGEPSMTDEEYDELVSDWMDRFPEPTDSAVPVDEKGGKAE